MRHPFTSSELFNAFSGECSQRENRTMSCINNNHKNMWAPTNNVSHTFSPPSQVMKESRSKMGSQCYSDSLQSDGFKASKIEFYPNQQQEQENFNMGQNYAPHSENDYYDEQEQEDYNNMTEQDFDGHDDGIPDEEDDLDDDRGEHQVDQDHEESHMYQDEQHEDFSQEGNIQGSSMSGSPDEKPKQVNLHNKPVGQFLSNIYEEHEDDQRESNMRSSDQTYGKSSLNSDMNMASNGNMIVERNDRFIIFKMVPQANSVKQNQRRDQPTPVLGERQMDYQNNKVYRETVEDIESSDTDSQLNQNQLPLLKLDSKQMQSMDNLQSPVNNNIDESLFEETHVVQHEIRTMRNQLINQSQSQLNKPPICRKSEQTTPLASNQRTFMNYKQLSKNQSNNQLIEESKQVDLTDLSIKKSLTAISRSSSDKFSRLQKLEKKNINDEKLEAGDFTLTKTNLNYALQQQQLSSPQRTESDKLHIDQLVVMERNNKEDSKTQVNLSTNNTNDKVSFITQNNEQQKKTKKGKEGGDNDKLLEEYMMLKKMVKQMKNEPQQTGRDHSKQGKLDESKLKKTDQKVLQSQRLGRQQNTKSKANLKNQHQVKESQFKSSHLMSSGMSDEQEEDHKIGTQLKANKSGIYTVQQSTKNQDTKNKNFFNNNHHLKTDIKRDQSKNKLSQRYSPNREPQQRGAKSKSKQKQQKPQYNKRVDNDSDTEEDYHMSSHSSPEKSYMLQQNKKSARNLRQTEKQKPKKQLYHKHKRQHHESSEEDQYSSEDDQHQYTQSYDNSKSQYEGHSRSYYDRSNMGDHRDDSYDQEDSVSDQQEDSDEYYSEHSHSNEDSQQYSHSSSERSCSGSESELRHQRKKSHSRRPKDQSQSRKRKGKKVSKTYKQGDRKFKINFHMHGDKQSRQRQDKQASQDGFLQQQRQLLQQQQYLMQLAQLPQQQMLLQQQLALQQQMLMQPAPAFSPNNLQQSMLNLAQPQPASQVNIQGKLLPQANNVSVILNQQQHSEDQYPSRNLKSQTSGQNMSQYIPSTNSNPSREYINANLSPKRDPHVHMNTGSSTKAYAQQNIGYVRSPRELSIHQQNSNEHAQNQANQQANYLNHLKNRFKTGQGSSSNREILEDDQYQHHPSAGQGANFMNSRNNQILQNNSSPLGRQQRPDYNAGFQYSHHQRPESIDFRDGVESYQNKFAIKPQFVPESYKHTRTSSYIDQNQERINRLKQNDQIFNEELSKMEQKRRINKPYQEQEENDYQLGRFNQKKTGEFGTILKVEQVQKTDNLFDQQRDATRSPSLGECDLSMDEGVKASTTRQTMQKSPKATEADFQLSNKKTTNINAVKQSPGKKGVQSKADQDKKGPQAIFIGFDEDQSVKDPFQNKPALKSREQGKDALLRSKSTKGTTPSAVKGQQNPSFQQRRSPDQRSSQQEEDKQLRSPFNKYAKKAQLPENQPMLAKKNESPLKRAVKEIKQKENFSIQDAQEEVVDTKQGKGIMIEIFDNKKSEGQAKEVSLAEMFKAKKKEAILNKKQDQDQASVPRSGVFDQEQDNHPGAKKQEKTKEELAAMRKAMMKSKVKRNQDNFNEQSATNNGGLIDLSDPKKGPKKDPKQDLMTRLAMGQKVTVDKKEMKKLTNKNYQNLPEIKKKKEEEKKKQEHLARKAATAEYMKQLNEKRKQLLKKKKSIVDDE